MLSMESKLDNWKNKLLDMGKRNKLLNYRDTRRSNLRIKVPSIYDLWNVIVINEQPLEFPFADEEQDQQLSVDLSDGEIKPVFSTIQTNQSIKEQQRTLRNLRDKAKTIMEEQGVNVLYLSFGFLRWNEAKQSRVQYDSPLVLVPVKLSWESITSPFILSLNEDEIVLNPTLSFKIDSDFGIKLPVFSSEDGLAGYFKKVQQLTEVNHWEIIPEVGLGLLSFLKINMYRDLERHRDAILENPIVRALGGDAAAVVHDLSSIDHYDHDNNTTPESTFQVVDADASQQDAILCAKQGISFVLQGPPGTGKSQTITNIIAEQLADGKKVLFVSEKMAALEVVYKRLKDAGLSEFCLILHSYKASKKDTLAQLGNVLSLANQKAVLSDDIYQKLTQLTEDRKRLNEYSDAIFDIVEPLHKNIYQVNGYLANLQNYSDVIFSVPNVRQTTPQQYDSYINALTRFSDTISGMSDDYAENPWYGANVEFVSNELRHNINSNLNHLIQKIQKTEKLICDINSVLSLNIEPTYIKLKESVSFLKLAARSPKVPLTWLVEDTETLPLMDEVAECEKLQTAFLAQQKQIFSHHRDILQNDSSADFSRFNSLCSTINIDAHITGVRDYIENAEFYSAWAQIADQAKVRGIFSLASEKIGEYNSICKELEKEYEQEIFSVDFNAMYRRFKSDYASMLKIFKSQYRADKKLIQSLHRERGKKLSDEEIFTLLGQMRHLDELKHWMDENSGSLHGMFGALYHEEKTDFDVLAMRLTAYELMQSCIDALYELRNTAAQYEAKETSLRDHYETLYSGLDTDWDKVRNALDWAGKFYRAMREISGYNQDFLQYICTSDDKITLCATYGSALDEAINGINPEFDWFLHLFQQPDEWKRVEMPDLAARLNACLNNLAALEEWIDFRTIRDQCSEAGLREYIEQIEVLTIDAAYIVPVFQKRFFRLWLDSVLPEYPAIANFRRRTQESIIQEFDRLDKLQFAIAKSRVRSKLINSLPSLDHFTSGIDEISILKRELNKQRRIMPLRRLFKEIPNLILCLKPCLMMSPLSVSLFLEADSFTFDTVIFDEASQVCTENAIGAILRGKQVIIAGDRHQLPPTNFFAAAVSNESDFDGDSENEDEYDDSAAYESVLDEAALLPERELLWHYRSRHEHLIAFSNAKIYRERLITFPSSIDDDPNAGVKYYYVANGFYDRGGRKGNVIEAEKVVDLIFEHFRQFPNRSLGVIAFGEVQQQAIDTILRKRRMENQQFERFFNEDLQEAFFVKSLENVQGDERDTIIFSIGYAKDAAGVMRMNFGPLSKSGGERRLNVAITRAKYNVKLVGSILPTDINIDRVTEEGPKLLRSYIDFAMNGPSVLLDEISAQDIIQHDSPFEEAVFNFLDRNGYKLATQVGCSGYRIDIAVKHPTLSGRFVLGIECDGASYHSARTARERDRLRQDVLESMGWKIYRIWSTDWIKDPITEGQRLIEAVNEAIFSYSEAMPEIIFNEEHVQSEEFITVEKKPAVFENSANPYGFEAPIVSDFGQLPHDANGFLQLPDCIMLVVNNEYPIHYELLCQKLSSLLGREKATSVVRREVDYGLKLLEKKVVRKGDFLYPADFSEIPVRQANGRTIKYISTDELSAAMLRILEKCIGTTRTALIDEATRAYSFNRRGVNIDRAMNMAFEQLVSEKKIREVDGKIVVNP